jgi:hypothetical protein
VNDFYCGFLFWSWRFLYTVVFSNVIVIIMSPLLLIFLSERVFSQNRKLLIFLFYFLKTIFKKGKCHHVKSYFFLILKYWLFSLSKSWLTLNRCFQRVHIVFLKRFSKRLKPLVYPLGNWVKEIWTSIYFSAFICLIVFKRSFSLIPVNFFLLK